MKKCRQQQILDSDLKGAWHYNHVTFTPIAQNFMLYCRLIYMLSILCVRLTIKVKVGIPESLKVGWYPPKKTGSSHLKLRAKWLPALMPQQQRNVTNNQSSCSRNTRRRWRNSTWKFEPIKPVKMFFCLKMQELICICKQKTSRLWKFHHQRHWGE